METLVQKTATNEREKRTLTLQTLSRTTGGGWRHRPSHHRSPQKQFSVLLETQPPRDLPLLLCTKTKDPVTLPRAHSRNPSKTCFSPGKPSREHRYQDEGFSKLNLPERDASLQNGALRLLPSKEEPEDPALPPPHASRALPSLRRVTGTLDACPIQKGYPHLQTFPAIVLESYSQGKWVQCYNVTLLRWFSKHVLRLPLPQVWDGVQFQSKHRLCPLLPCLLLGQHFPNFHPRRTPS